MGGAREARLSTSVKIHGHRCHMREKEQKRGMDDGDISTLAVGPATLIVPGGYNNGVCRTKGVKRISTSRLPE